MTKEEIAAGLKQAVERGESLEQAKRSFINAGYSRQEVEEAASTLGGVLTEFPQPTTTYQPPPIPTSSQKQTPTQPRLSTQQLTPPLRSQKPQIKQLPQPQLPEKKPKKRIVILIVILIILFILLTTSFFLKNQILEFINNLF